MPEVQDLPVYRLPITGRRNGRNKQVIGYAFVADNDLARNYLAKRTWHLCNGYPATNIRCEDGSYKQKKLHHWVYEEEYGPIPPGYELDHTDRVKVNALRTNLRLATRSMNSANKGRRRDNSSGFKCVSWDKARQMWVAIVTKDGVHHYLGGFTTPEAAARAVNRKYREIYPDVAIPNPTAEIEQNHPES